MSLKTAIPLLLCAALAFASCTQETEELNLPEYQQQSLTELLPLQIGKYITYRLDSLVFTNLGTKPEIHRYTVKYLVDTIFKDNLGQMSYRIYRYLNDSLANGHWTPAGTLYTTPYNDRIEEVEDNLRTVVLATPVREGFSWKGNRHIDSEPYGLRFTNMQDWSYTYSNSATEEIGGKPVPDVRTIYKESRTLNALYDRAIVDTQQALNITALAKYAKNIGLVYKEQTLWEHQNELSGVIVVDPVTKDTTEVIRHNRSYKTGFGIRMWMIDHN